MCERVKEREENRERERGREGEGSWHLLARHGALEPLWLSAKCA